MLEISDWKTVHQSLPFEIDEIKKTVIKLVESSRFAAVGDTVKWKELGRAVYDRLTSFAPVLEPDATQETHSAFKLTREEYAFLLLGSVQ